VPVREVVLSTAERLARGLALGAIDRDNWIEHSRPGGLQRRNARNANNTGRCQHRRRGTGQAISGVVRWRAVQGRGLVGWVGELGPGCWGPDERCEANILGARPVALRIQTQPAPLPRLTQLEQALHTGTVDSSALIVCQDTFLIPPHTPPGWDRRLGYRGRRGEGGPDRA